MSITNGLQLDNHNEYSINNCVSSYPVFFRLFFILFPHNNLPNISQQYCDTWRFIIHKVFFKLWHYRCTISWRGKKAKIYKKIIFIYLILSVSVYTATCQHNKDRTFKHMALSKSIGTSTGPCFTISP